MALSRCYTRRIGRDSPNLPGSGKWTSTSPAPTSCAIGPEPRTGTAKPTPLPPNADRGGTARALPQQRGTFPRAVRRLCSRANWLRRYHDTVLPKGAHFWFKGDDGLWWLGEISAITTEDNVYLVCFLDDPGPIELPLPPARYTTSTGAVRGSWCLQVHTASEFPRGIQRNVHESRGAAVAS